MNLEGARKSDIERLQDEKTVLNNAMDAINLQINAIFESSDYAKARKARQDELEEISNEFVIPLYVARNENDVQRLRLISDTVKSKEAEVDEKWNIQPIMQEYKKLKDQYSEKSKELAKINFEISSIENERIRKEFVEELNTFKSEVEEKQVEVFERLDALEMKYLQPYTEYGMTKEAAMEELRYSDNSREYREMSGLIYKIGDIDKVLKSIKDIETELSKYGTVDTRGLKRAQEQHKRNFEYYR